MMKKTFLTLLVFMLCLTFIQTSGGNVQAKEIEIQVYYEGERLVFEDTDPVLKDTRTMVPFRKIFETLGFEVEWYDGAVQRVVGTKEGYTIELEINSKKAKVNGKVVELDVPAQILKERTIVPLRFISENSGYHVFFEDQAGTFIVGIGRTELLADPSFSKAEPFVVKGSVLNTKGEPVPWAEVYADNTFQYDSNILGVTDEQGYYRIELPAVNTTYRMGSRFETTYNGVNYAFYSYPEPNHAFGANTGAVRNMVLDTSTGNVELYTWDYEYEADENAPMFEMHDVEVTLKPVGKLLDGSAGSIITGFPIYDDGPRLTNVPIGTYEVSAIWKPKGYQAVPMLVSVRNKEAYGASATINFENPFADYHRTQVEVQFP